MKSMLASLALQAMPGHYGFFGIQGVFGIFIGLIFLIIVAGICWKILTLVLPKLGVDATWVQVIYWFFVLCLVIAFAHFFGFY